MAIYKLEKIIEELKEVLLKKGQDYGDSYKEWGVLGLLVRVGDKYNRLKHLMFAERKPNYETIRDTILDLANYSILMLSEYERTGGRLSRIVWDKKANPETIIDEVLEE